ncbi:MAG: glycosyltransferase family 2 protein [Acidobacteria bacterium]|nr:glycosyltransferase family 2 protein [Acidobacteriota bacterium]
MNTLSIVIPAYNEEARLPATIERVAEFLAQGPWDATEILVVDDGSRDGTVRAVQEYQKKLPGLRLLRNPGNRGKGYSVRHGMLEARGQWVLFSDADLSAPIEEMAKLMEAARREGAQVVIGSRALDRSLIGVHQTGFREWAGRIFNLCVRLIVRLPFADTQCGFKLFSAKAASEIFRRAQVDRWGFDPELLFIARKLGFKTVEVPVRWNHAEGAKISVFRDSARMFYDVARVRWFQFKGFYK